MEKEPILPQDAESPQKVILIITGQWDGGKTASVKGIFHYFDSIPGRIVFQDYPQANAEKPHEIKSILVVNGIKIGFESEGDPGSRLVTEKLKDQIAEKCDLIICAARTGLSRPECRPLIYLLEELQTYHQQYKIICTSNYEDIERNLPQARYDSWNDLFVQSAIRLIKDLFPTLP